MQRGTTPDRSNDLHARAFAVSPLNINNFIALSQAEVHCLLNQLVQITHGNQCGISDIQTAFHHIAKFQQAHAKSVGTGMGSINEATRCQVVQNSMGC